MSNLIHAAAKEARNGNMDINNRFDILVMLFLIVGPQGFWGSGDNVISFQGAGEHW